MTVTTLSDVDHGIYVVATEHSCYQVNMDKRTIFRVRAVGDSSNLRGDYENVDLKQILTCEVGLPAVFVVKDLTPGVTTIRRTTRITGIEVVA